jgi:hypothetical protein
MNWLSAEPLSNGQGADDPIAGRCPVQAERQRVEIADEGEIVRIARSIESDAGACLERSEIASTMRHIVILKVSSIYRTMALNADRSNQ